MGRLLAGLAVVLAGVCGGCGSATPAAPSSVPSMDALPGVRVGELAEKQLEAEHTAMAVGTMTCPDLPWKVDASVRCVKVAELSDGRRVTVPGTVTVTSTRGWGRLHVEMDDAIAEFGVTSSRVSESVADWVRARVKATAARVRCPYLRGVTGTVAHCTVTVAGRQERVQVTVTGVDPRNYRTTYALSWKRAAATSSSKACLRCG